MKIALFGGRFDPVHNGHIAVAREVLKMKAADEVWFSVENQHQWRPIVASAEDRETMLRLAIQFTRHPERSEGSQSKNKPALPAGRDSSALPQNDSNNTLKVDTTPLELGGQTTTLFVVRELRKKFPQHDFVFVVGSDNMNVFHKWTHWEELEKEVHFLVIARKGSPVENVPENATVITDPTYEPLEDSATRVRELLGQGKSIHGLVPDSVENYIIEHKLYR